MKKTHCCFVNLKKEIVEATLNLRLNPIKKNFV